MLDALEQLGYKCYHMASIIRNPPDGPMWTEAAEAKWNNKGTKFTRKEWDQLLGDCNVSPISFRPNSS